MGCLTSYQRQLASGLHSDLPEPLNLWPVTNAFKRHQRDTRLSIMASTQVRNRLAVRGYKLEQGRHCQEMGQQLYIAARDGVHHGYTTFAEVQCLLRRKADVNWVSTVSGAGSELPDFHPPVLGHSTTDTLRSIGQHTIIVQRSSSCCSSTEPIQT